MADITVDDRQIFPSISSFTGAGTSAVGVSQELTSLSQGTLYHYRVVASSEAGTSYGEDQTLTTPVPTYQSSFGSAGSGSGQFAHPAGSAVDASGNLWVVDQNNDRVEKFSAGGEYLTKFGSAGSGNGQFNGPETLAIDAKGNIW
jgi:DNA-binding beta-propeller fold protein YncE